MVILLRPSQTPSTLLPLAFGCLAACASPAPCEAPPRDFKVVHLNPPQLPNHPAFSQAVSVEGPIRWIIVGGQNAVDRDGRIADPQDVALQTQTALANLETVLDAAGASIEDVLHWRIWVVPGEDGDGALAAAFAAASDWLGPLENPPAITVLQVVGLAHPSFRVEIEALAAVPGTRGRTGP